MTEAVYDVVGAALELSPDARASFLERACASDGAFRREAERLLASCNRAERETTFLAQPAAVYAEPLLLDVDAAVAEMDKSVLAELEAGLRDRYAIERELGRGGMATVYLAQDKRHARQVAIKVIHPELAWDIGVERFTREISIAASLRHPNIVSLYDSGEVRGLLYFVMPFIDGKSLPERLRDERQLPIGDAIDITTEVAAALDFAHAHGVIHRDIKPQNILLDRGRALVADFGVARAMEPVGNARLTESGTAIGTPLYMSPEQAGGEARIDGRSDVYSLACVVYEMLAGEPPFTGPSPRAVLAKQMHAPIPDVNILRPTAGTSMQRVLERALAKVPADRFGTAAAFSDALRRAAHARAAPRIRRTWVATGVTLGLVVAGIVATNDHLKSGAVAPTPGISAFDPRRVAVLYFENATSNARLEPLVNGLTEDLIDRLSQVGGNNLRVISPNGVRPFQHSPKRLDSMAVALGGVGTFVAGRVVDTGDFLHVTVRLIDAASGEQLQARTLERPLGDLFTLQANLASEVALFLRERLGSEITLRQQRAESKSVKAWEMVQQAQALAREGADVGRRGENARAEALLLRADSLLSSAEALDPAWLEPTVARGWVARSLSYVSRGPPGEIVDPGRRRSPLSIPWLLRATALSERALSKKPGAADALALRGEMRYRLVVFGNPAGGDSLLPLAEADLRTALLSRPDYARAWYSLGELMWEGGRFDEAARALHKAYDTDAFLTEIRSVVNLLIFTSLETGRFEDARSWCRLGVERYAGDPRFENCEVTLLGWSGSGRDAAADAWNLVRSTERRDSSPIAELTWGFRRMMVAAILARSGMRDSAQAVLLRIHAEQPRHPSSDPSPGTEAYVELLLGHREAALRLLENLLHSTPNARYRMARSPLYAGLRDDPRFQSIIRAPF